MMASTSATETEERVTLPARWGRRWASEPGAATFVTSDRRGAWLDAGEVDESTRAVAANLASRGVGLGDRVGWQADATSEALLVALGALRLGAVLVPLSASQSQLERSNVLSEVEPVIVVSAAGSKGGDCDPAELLAPGSSDVALDGVATDDLAVIVFTSGTTGHPKGVMLTHGNLASQVDSLAEAWGWTSGDRLVSALPLFHVHGLIVAVLASLSVGASVAIEPSFDAGTFASRADELSATMTFCVPTMLHRIAAAGQIEPLRHLRLVVSGSAPLSRELFDAFGSEGVPILERYGMTETLLTISNPLEGERRAGSVGFALPGVELDLPKPDDTKAELRVAGPTVFAGYWRRPNATAEVLDDGWVRTGDVVSVDEDGFIRICGRQKDLIITGGFNVYPTEVEDVLTRDPAIREAGVVGVASPEWGEEVVAFVVAAGGSVDARAAVDRQSMLLSSYKRPRRIIMVDELPRNAMGKLQRHLLRP